MIIISESKTATRKEIVRYYLMNDVSLTQNNVPENYPAHWHSDAEFTLVLKEGVEYRIGNVIYRPHPGDILLVWPREIHSIINIPKNGAFFIQFSSGMIENNRDLVSASILMTSLHAVSGATDPELARSMGQKLYEIRDCFVSHSYFSETRCKRSIYEMLLIIGDHVVDKNREITPGPGSFDVSFEYVRSACRYIADHSSDDISQSEVADAMGLSSSYFSRLFKKYTQRSFPIYLAEIRVQNAIHLLTQDNLSVTECAFLAGFQSITTFNKVFHDMTGYSPRDYRKLHSKRISR